MGPGVPARMARHENRGIDCGDLSPFKQQVKCFPIALGSASSGQGTLSCWHKGNSSWFIYHLLPSSPHIWTENEKVFRSPFYKNLPMKAPLLQSELPPKASLANAVTPEIRIPDCECERRDMDFRYSESKIIKDISELSLIFERM